MIVYLMLLYASTVCLPLGELLNRGLTRSGKGIKLPGKVNFLLMFILQKGSLRQTKRFAPSLPSLPHHGVTNPYSNAIVFAPEPDEH